MLSMKRIIMKKKNLLALLFITLTSLTAFSQDLPAIDDQEDLTVPIDNYIPFVIFIAIIIVFIRIHKSAKRTALSQ